jgi:hypothetical protein
MFKKIRLDAVIEVVVPDKWENMDEKSRKDYLNDNNLSPFPHDIIRSIEIELKD